MTTMPNNEHTEKYEALAKEYGIDNLCKVIPFSKDQVKKALESGDEHLNSLPLAKWDRASGYAATYNEVRELYSKFWKRGSSLCERICILKHVAKYHYAYC